MFGQKTKKQLEKALEVIDARITVTKELGRLLEETERQLSEAMTIVSEAMTMVKHSVANADECSAIAEKWRRRYEDAQPRPGGGPVLCMTTRRRLTGG